jgi:hypothetical protein
MHEVAGTGVPSVMTKGIFGLIVTLNGPFTSTKVETVGVGEAGNFTSAVKHGLPLIS